MKLPSLKRPLARTRRSRHPSRQVGRRINAGQRELDISTSCARRTDPRCPPHSQWSAAPPTARRLRQRRGLPVRSLAATDLRVASTRFPSTQTCESLTHPPEVRGARNVRGGRIINQGRPSCGQPCAVAPCVARPASRRRRRLCSEATAFCQVSQPNYRHEAVCGVIVLTSTRPLDVRGAGAVVESIGDCVDSCCRR